MKLKLTDRLNYIFINAVCLPLSVLPLKVLYIFSDFLAWLAGSVVRYRRRVVRQNLSSSFPDKDEKELRRIEKGFYQFLCDYFFETIKLRTMSDSYMRRHFTVENAEFVDRALAEGRSVTCYVGHYCNWEWASSLPLYFTPGSTCAQIYHPLYNKGADLFFYKLRTRFHAHNLPMKESFQQLIRWKRAGIPSVTGYIADQAPKFSGIHLFLDFLNHDTGVYTGPERIARILDSDVVYFRMSRPERGRYNLEIVPIAYGGSEERPGSTLPLLKDMETFEPTRSYFALLQDDIERAPQYWLWSHRRWKRSRAQFMEYLGDKAEAQLRHL